MYALCDACDVMASGEANDPDCPHCQRCQRQREAFRRMAIRDEQCMECGYIGGQHEEWCCSQRPGEDEW